MKVFDKTSDLYTSYNVGTLYNTILILFCLAAIGIASELGVVSGQKYIIIAANAALLTIAAYALVSYFAPISLGNCFWYLGITNITLLITMVMQHPIALSTAVPAMAITATVVSMGICLYHFFTHRTVKLAGVEGK